MSKKVFFCNCGAKVIEATRLMAILEYLKQTGHPFTEISDLCGCSIDRKDEVRDLILSSEERLLSRVFRVQ